MLDTLHFGYIWELYSTCLHVDKIAFRLSVLCVPQDWAQDPVLANSMHTRCTPSCSLSPISPILTERGSHCKICTLLPHILFVHFSKWPFSSHLWGAWVHFEWQCLLPTYQLRGFFLFLLLLSVVTSRCVLVTSNCCNRISQSGRHSLGSWKAPDLGASASREGSGQLAMFSWG